MGSSYYKTNQGTRDKSAQETKLIKITIQEPITILKVLNFFNFVSSIKTPDILCNFKII